MGFLLVLRAELVRSLIIMRRYWFATLIGLIIGYGMLVTLAMAFLSGRVDTSEIGERFTPGAINGTLGLLIGMLAFSLVGMFSQGLQAMARSGELEQLYMSPHGLITNFMARSFVSALSQVISMAVMLWLVDRTLGGLLDLDGTDVVLLILFIGLTFVNLIGFGFMIGGLVLVFKQTGNVATIVRLVLMGLAVMATPEALILGDPGAVPTAPSVIVEAAPNDDVAAAAVAEAEPAEEAAQPWPMVVRAFAHILPVTDAAVCLKLIIIRDAGLTIFAPPNVQFVFFLLLNCVIWTGLGVTCFKFMERWSRSKGTLGAY